jgi:uncharacterized protein YvpB
MKLKDFVGENIRYESNKIAADLGLSQELQALLIEIGLLSGVEEPFGAGAMAALTRFQRENDCYEPEFLGPLTAEKLLEVAEVGSRAPVSIITIQALQATVLKLRPLDSQVLEEKEKVAFESGATLELTLIEPERKHFKVTLSQAIQGSSVWYAFSEHVKVSGADNLKPLAKPADEKPSTSVKTPPSTVKLDVPYKSQRDNANNPDGSCNVTSLAMCLEFLSIPRRSTSGQFEDELYEYALDHNLSRHDPYDLAKIVKAYGGKDSFDSTSSMKAVKDWLASGNPAVTHGYFTGSGHIVAIVGYDDAGFIVNDPYGEWYASGYDRNDPSGNNTKGKFKHYSYQMIEDTCASDNQFWVHSISK